MPEAEERVIKLMKDGHVDGFAVTVVKNPNYLTRRSSNGRSDGNRHEFTLDSAFVLRIS